MNEKQYFIIFLCMWVFCLLVCLCRTSEPGARESKQKVSDALELQIQTFVSTHVGAWERILSSVEERPVFTSKPSIFSS